LTDIIEDLKEVIAQLEGKGYTETAILRALGALATSIDSLPQPESVAKTVSGQLAVGQNALDLLLAPGLGTESKFCPANGKVTILAIGNGNIPQLKMAGASGPLNGNLPTSAWFVAQVPVHSGWTLLVTQVAQLLALDFEEGQ